MPITPPYPNVDSSLVWELRATAVDSYQTQRPHTKEKSGEPTQGGLSPLHCHIPDTSKQENCISTILLLCFPTSEAGVWYEYSPLLSGATGGWLADRHSTLPVSA